MYLKTFEKPLGSTDSWKGPCCPSLLFNFKLHFDLARTRCKQRSVHLIICFGPYFRYVHILSFRDYVPGKFHVQPCLTSVVSRGRQFLSESSRVYFRMMVCSLSLSRSFSGLNHDFISLRYANLQIYQGLIWSLRQFGGALGEAKLDKIGLAEVPARHAILLRLASHGKFLRCNAQRMPWMHDLRSRAKCEMENQDEYILQ